MESLRNDSQREILIRFFKTAPGEYGFGDEFIGLKVPQTREVVREVAKGISLDEVPPAAATALMLISRQNISRVTRRFI